MRIATSPPRGSFRVPLGRCKGAVLLSNFVLLIGLLEKTNQFLSYSISLHCITLNTLYFQVSIHTPILFFHSFENLISRPAKLTPGPTPHRHLFASSTSLAASVAALSNFVLLCRKNPSPVCPVKKHPICQGFFRQHQCSSIVDH